MIEKLIDFTNKTKGNIFDLSSPVGQEGHIIIKNYYEDVTDTLLHGNIIVKYKDKRDICIECVFGLYMYGEDM